MNTTRQLAQQLELIPKELRTSKQETLINTMNKTMGFELIQFTSTGDSYHRIYIFARISPMNFSYSSIGDICKDMEDKDSFPAAYVLTGNRLAIYHTVVELPELEDEGRELIESFEINQDGIALLEAWELLSIQMDKFGVDVSYKSMKYQIGSFLSEIFDYGMTKEAITEQIEDFATNPIEFFKELNNYISKI